MSAPTTAAGILGSSPPTTTAPFASSAWGVFGCCAATDAGAGAGACACFGGRVDCAIVAPTAAAATSSSADGAGMRSGSHLLLHEGARAKQTASSWADQRDWRKGMDQELEPQAIIQKHNGALLETTNETQRVPKNVNSVHQKETHSGCLPAMSDETPRMSLKVENCETPRSHQSSIVPYAMSSSKTNDELQSSATSPAINVDELTNENITEACAQNEEHQTLDPAKDFEQYGVSKEDFLHPEQSEEDPKCAKNDNVAAMKISISDEYSLFQSSEDSISSSNKIRDSVNTPSMEKSLETEATIHATRKKVLKNNDSELELPSLSHWLKPANPKKPFRDEALTGHKSRSAKSSDEDRPIIGMVTAHWKDKEPDQKVSWHATLFGERLEKALSEEKLLSERNCSSGKTSQFLGVEDEESHTAESNRLYATAYA
ncbi:protein JASON-like isoform X1 [Panicum miliaceum]|uniref:Protein JASON-like isoform X1 n=1 Tax=Panicum miliaceum TaxID=4540 RepID=A0A3L6PMH6_PANMI|nr:protein JASON-like isoform X1 [Panicum miliaceum]